MFLMHVELWLMALELGGAQAKRKSQILKQLGSQEGSLRAPKWPWLAPGGVAWSVQNADFSMVFASLVSIYF